MAAALVGLGVVDLSDPSLFAESGPSVGPRASREPSAPSPGAVERSGSLRSRYTGSAMGWTVSVPAGPDPPRGILYCLHGYHSNHRMAFDQIHVPDAAASVGLRVVVAAVDGGADSYWHKRSDGTDAGSMLLEEFVPLVRGMVGRLPQALMGWSMGGYGALLAAEHAAERAAEGAASAFVAVAPASPALWLTPGATAPGAFDSPADFYANDVFTGISRLHNMTVAVACGESDPFYQATRELVAGMDYPHRAFFGPGSHDDAYWRSAAPAQLGVLLAAFGR